MTVYGALYIVRTVIWRTRTAVRVACYVCPLYTSYFHQSSFHWSCSYAVWSAVYDIIAATNVIVQRARASRQPPSLHADTPPLVRHIYVLLTATLRYSDASIYRNISYRIARRNIEIFDIPVSTFWFIILPNFHVWCQEVVEFSLKLSLKLSLTVKVSMKVLIKISRLLDTTRENSARESLNFSLWENFVKFYITTYSRVQKFRNTVP